MGELRDSAESLLLWKKPVLKVGSEEKWELIQGLIFVWEVVALIFHPDTFLALLFGNNF